MNQEQLIHYSDYPGREPTYVFVHGFTCNETDFVNQVEHFRGIGHRVITLDLPGHGLSIDYIPKDLTMKAMGRHVVTLLRHLEVKEAIMIGHSMGCMVVTEVALQAPDVVIGIVLIDGSRIARGDPEEAVATRRKVFEDEGFKKCMMNTFEPMFLPGSDETEKKRIIDRACTQPEHASIDILLSAVRWCAEDFESAYTELKVPVQVRSCYFLQKISAQCTPNSSFVFLLGNTIDS